MTNKVIKKVKVVKVTKTEFELEDGRVYPHPVELDYVPSLKEFQKTYNEWAELLSKKLEENGKTDNN
jgi:hypothetical protein